MAEIRERPILFSGKMVQAILAGHKTQTRRIVTAPVPDGADEVFLWEPSSETVAAGIKIAQAGLWARRNDGCEAGEGWIRWVGFPYARVGDRLWVRETHCFCPRSALAKTWSHTPEEARALYRADGPMRLSGPHGFWEPKWRPSIHMPRWASRLTLEVLAVRVQRLQEISEADAKAEGVDFEVAFLDNEYGQPTGNVGKKYRGEFRRLWDEINGKRASWVSNPWVWVVSFRRVVP